MNDLGDVQLGGKNFKIDIASWKTKDLADFSPRASVPGGSIVMSELMLYQPIYLTDWRHGFGFTWNTDALGYMYTKGNIDTRWPGIVTLSTDWHDRSDTGETSIKSGMVSFNNYLWSWGPGGLRKMNYGTYAWTSEYASAVNCVLATENYLFYCPDGARIRKVDKTGVHSDAGTTSASADYKWMIIFQGKIYAGEDGNNRVHYATKDDLSDLEGGAGDIGVIYAGAGGYATLGAASYAGYLYVFRPDGIWAIGTDNIAKNVLDYTAEMSIYNFKGVTVYNGYLYFTVGEKIYQWNGSRVQDVSPPRFSDSFPYSEVDGIYGLTTARNFLWGIFRWKEVSGSVTHYNLSVFSYDGVGWHKIHDLYSDLNDLYVGAGLYYDPGKIELVMWMTRSTPGLVTSVFTVHQGNASPYAYFPISGQNSLYTSRLDAGFRRVRKSMPSLLIEASNVSTLQYIDVYFSTDGGGFYNWGRITQNGITELTFPSGIRTIEFNYIIFRLDFVTGIRGQTPILEGLTMRFLLRPDVFYGYNFNIIAANNLTYGETVDGRSPYQYREQLRTMRDSKAPLPFIDIFGQTGYVYITSLTESGAELHAEMDDGIPNVEGIINVNLVEVRPYTSVVDPFSHGVTIH